MKLIKETKRYLYTWPKNKKATAIITTQNHEGKFDLEVGALDISGVGKRTKEECEFFIDMYIEVLKMYNEDYVCE